MDCRCGRSHYAIDSGDLSEQAVEEALSTQSESPNKVVIHHGCDALYATMTGLRLCVDNCPCGTIGLYRDLVDRDRSALVRYFLAVDAQQQRALDENRAEIGRLQP
jgi:hypothetical protein